MARTGRPKKAIDEDQLAALMRLQPTCEDAAAFFKVDRATIERHIKSRYRMTFAAFREQNMAHTRLNLVRNALKMAERDKIMLIFCLKNLCGWKDKQELSTPGGTAAGGGFVVQLSYDPAKSLNTTKEIPANGKQQARREQGDGREAIGDGSESGRAEDGE